ncbi:MAG TPA: Ig-like domain-containing protein [Chitinophagaceae bacterium]
MKITLNKIFLLMAVFVCTAGFAQTPGLIFKQATSAMGRAVMDPNGDGYVSATNAGFSGTDYGSASELPLIALPIIGSEPMSDLTTGSNGGLTDIVSFGTTRNSVFVLKKTISSGTYAGDYFIVRFRVGKNGSAGKGYSILIDVDGTNFGSQYASTPSNPGYEKELVLQTGSQPKVVIYNYNNTTGAQSSATEYTAGDDYHQRSIALSTNGGDADFFYDFFVPFSYLGLTTQPVRLVATTVTNSVSAITGVKSDFNGINDLTFGNDPAVIQQVLIAAFPATPLNALTTGGAFNPVATTAPLVASGINAAAASVSGTSQEISGTSITVYRNRGGSVSSIGTATVGSDGSWSLSSLASNVLQVADSIYATATASEKTVSANSNKIAVAAAVRCYLEPPTLTVSSNGSMRISVSWNWPAGVTPVASQAQIKIYQLDQLQQPGSSWANSGVTQYYGLTSGVATDYLLGGSGNVSGSFVGTISYAGCVSPYSDTYKEGNKASDGVITNTPSISSPATIYASTGTQSVTITNNHTSTAKMYLFVNGVVADSAGSSSLVAAGGTVQLTLPAVNTGDIVTARAIGSAANNMLSAASAAKTVTESSTTTTAPVISGSYTNASTYVRGTSTEAEGTVIYLYKAGSTLLGSTTVTSQGTWIVDSLTLAASDQLTTKAKAVGEVLSAASTPAVTVQAAPTTPAVTGTYFAGATSVSGTGTNGNTITLYVDGSPVYSNGTAMTTTVSGGTWTISGLPSGTLYRGALITATATNAGLESSQSGSVTVTGVVSFAITNTSGGAIGSITAGSPFTVKIVAKDAANGTGNTVTSFTGKVVLSGTSTVTDGANTLAFVNGELASHSITLTTAGSDIVLTAVNAEDPLATGTATITTINPAAVSKLIISQPANTSTLTRATYTVSRADTYNNLVTTGGAITVSLASSPAGADFYNQLTLGSTITTADIANGQSTATFYFGGLTAGTYYLTASYTGLTEAKDTISIYGTASKFIVTAPGYARTGSTITVTAQLADNNNNSVPTSGLVIAWSSANGGSFSNATTTDATGKATASFTVSAVAGTVHTATALSGVTGTSANITTTSGYVWTGTNNTNAATSTNWQAGVAPGTGADVLILGTATNAAALVEDVTFKNLVIESGGRIDLNGSKMTITGDVSGTGVIRGSSTSSLEVTSTASGTLYFDRSEPTDRSNNMLLNFTMNRPGGSITLGNELMVKGALTLTSGTLNTSDSLVIASDADGTGYISGDMSLITGKVTAERFISSNIIDGITELNRAWRLLAPIVTTTTSIRDNWQQGVNNADLVTNLDPKPGYGTHITGSTTGANGFDATQTGQASMYTYNQASQQWQGINNTNVNTLDPKTGYLIFVRGDRSMNLNSLPSGQGAANTRLRARGTLVTTDQSFTGLATTTGHFSLVTNPFASSLDWSLIYADGTNSNDFENAYTTWDPNIGDRGGFVTVTNGNIASAGSSTIHIQSGTAFFVQRKSTATGNTLTLKTSHRSTTNNIDVFRSGNQQELLRVSLYYQPVSGARRLADGAVVVYNNQYSASVDQNDAQQIGNWDEDIAIKREGKMLSIETRPLADAGDTVQLNVARLKTISYEWQFKPENINAPGLVAVLRDNYLNQETPVSLTAVTTISFAVNSDPASKAADRFSILYRNNAALPVVFISNKAYRTANGISVDWKVENNELAGAFVVEKSTNGILFADAASVTPQSAIVADYRWWDQTPAPGISYYRIRCTGKDNVLKYSSTMVVSASESGTMQVYPNPAGASCRIRIPEMPPGRYRIVITDAAGAKAVEQMVEHAGGAFRYDLQTDRLAHGVYRLAVTDGNLAFSTTIVKL